MVPSKLLILTYRRPKPNVTPAISFFSIIKCVKVDNNPIKMEPVYKLPINEEAISAGSSFC
jgi:hypothetical protein